MGDPEITGITNQSSLGKLKIKMMPRILKEKRQVHLAKTKRRRERSAPSLRLTSCIFKSRVTRITSHPGNQVRRRLWEESLEKPQQVCAYSRLRGLQARSSEGQLLSPFDITGIIGIIAPGSAGAGSLPSRSEPLAAGSSDGAEMIPGAGLGLAQLRCKQPVTPADIQRQTRKVKKARARLAVALEADRLASEAERASSQEGC